VALEKVAALQVAAAQESAVVGIAAEDESDPEYGLEKVYLGWVGVGGVVEDAEDFEEVPCIPQEQIAEADAAAQHALR
jgi:hypothetical protein